MFAIGKVSLILSYLAIVLFPTDPTVVRSMIGPTGDATQTHDRRRYAEIAAARRTIAATTRKSTASAKSETVSATETAVSVLSTSAAVKATTATKTSAAAAQAVAST